MPSSSMNIRAQQNIRQTSAADRQQIILDDIQELEAMLERGDIEKHAYFIKKRALIKLL